MLGRRKQRHESAPDTADIYRALRLAALESVATGLALPPSEHPDVSGVVVDIPAEGGFATVVALTDDTTSMYTSVGGGTLGLGGYPAVAAETHRVLFVVQAHLASFSRTDDFAFPPSGSVRFHVLTPVSSRCEDVPEDSFWGYTAHPLMPVIASTQELISAIREASAKE